MKQMTCVSLVLHNAHIALLWVKKKKKKGAIPTLTGRWDVNQIMALDNLHDILSYYWKYYIITYFIIILLLKYYGYHQYRYIVTPLINTIKIFHF